MIAAPERPDLVSQLAGRLSDAILSGSIPWGDRLNEVTLARQMGVSRGPLREAARLLESKGLLVAHPRRGFFVRTLDPAALEDIYDLRLCIESHGARLAATRMSATDHGRLALLTVRIGQTAGETALQVEADFAFHHELARLSGNARLLRVFMDLSQEIRLVLTLLGQINDKPEAIGPSHETILTALKANDPHRIGVALESHIHFARKRVVASLAARMS